MLAVIYARASPGEHSRRSVPEQLRLARRRAMELAGGQGLTIREFDDPETSGDIPPADRPGYAAALAAAREGRAAWFVCLDPDRFSRDVYQALGAAQEVDRTGARLTFVLHEYDMSPEGRMFFTFRVAIAEYEKHKIKERTQRGIRAKLARGGLPYAPRPYGYRFDKESDRLEVLPEQAAWVAAMYRWVAEERLGPQRIADRLNGLGVPAPRGRRWYRQAVSRMLRNPVYRGELVVRKTDQSGMRRNRHLPPEQRVSRRPRPPEEWVALPAPPVVSPELWKQAQAVLDRLRRRPAQPPAGYLLTGLAVCGLCGRPCHGFSNGRGSRYYVCAGRHGGREHRGPGQAEPCRLPHLRSGPLETQVRAVVGRWLEEPAAFSAARERWLAERGGGVQAELALVRRRRAELEAEWDRRLAAYHKGWVRDPGQAAAEMAELRRRVEALRRQEAALAAGAPDPGAGAPAGLGSPEQIRQLLCQLDPTGWQTAIRLLSERVVLHPDRAPRVEPRA